MKVSDPSQIETNTDPAASGGSMPRDARLPTPASADVAAPEKSARRGSRANAASAPVIGRLPRYFRCVRELLNRDVLRISSAELARYMGITAAQVRQDFSALGGFGRQGYGYNVKLLYRKMGELLGVPRRYRAVLLGAGGLGRFFCEGSLLETRGVRLVAVFDPDPALAGQQVGAFTVRKIETFEDYCAEQQPDIAIVTLSELSAAEKLTGLLSRCDLRGVWNCSDLPIDENRIGLPTENVNMADSLMMLTYRFAQEDATQITKKEDVR